MSYNKIVIEKKLREFLEEDCSFKDVSSQFLEKNEMASAKIISKCNGYVSGIEELKLLYDNLNVKVEAKKKDGDEISPSELIATLHGKAQNILLGERVILNLMTHMSAITTTTREFVDNINDSGKKCKIACTRKTTPGLRIFEKKAVELGGGDTHRFSLDDMILLKDTHLKQYRGNVKKLLSDVRKKCSFSKKVEIEIEKSTDVLIAAKNGADIIMLDNMDQKQVKESIELLESNNLRDKVLIEISGGITLQNLEKYLKNNPDIISSSKLTLFPKKIIDLSLRFD